jgi:hypothetical protein
MKRLHYFLAKRWVLSNGLKITVNLFKSNLLLLYFILSSYTVLGCFVMQNIFFSFLLGIKFIDWKHELGSCNLLFLRIFWGVILFGCWENGVGKESDFRKESENTWATLCLENVIPKSIQTRSEVSHNYYKQWPSNGKITDGSSRKPTFTTKRIESNTVFRGAFAFVTSSFSLQIE